MGKVIKSCVVSIGSYLDLLKLTAPLLDDKPITDEQVAKIFQAVHDQAFSQYFTWSKPIYTLEAVLVEIYHASNVYVPSEKGDLQYHDWVDEYDSNTCDKVVMSLLSLLSHYFDHEEDRLLYCKFDIIGDSVYYQLVNEKVANPDKVKLYVDVGGVVFPYTNIKNIISGQGVLIKIKDGKVDRFNLSNYNRGLLTPPKPDLSQLPPSPEIPRQSIVFDTSALPNSDAAVSAVSGLLQQLMENRINRVQLIITTSSKEMYKLFRSIVYQCNEPFGFDITTSYREKKPWGEELRLAKETLVKQIPTPVADVSDTVSLETIEALNEIRDRIFKRKRAPGMKITDFDRKCVMLMAPDVYKVTVDLNMFLHRLGTDKKYARNNTVLSGLAPSAFSENELVLLIAIDEYISANETDARTLNYLS